MKRTVNKRRKLLESGDYCLVDDVVLDDLPDYCLHNILARLPLESLCSLRLLCTTWYDIVNSIHFRNTHQHRFAGIIFLSSLNYNTRPKNVFFPKLNSTFTDEPSSIHMKFVGIKDGKTTVREYNTANRGRIVATCNGLIVFEKNLRAEGFVLLNPVTREQEDIPLGTISSMPHDRHGLGFCHASRRYKLLHLFMKDKFGNLGCEIMDIGSGLWRQVDVPPTERPHFLHSPVFAMGALHWIQYFGGQGDCVVSMPLDDEKFKIRKIPARTDGDENPFNTVFSMGEFLGFSSRGGGEANQIEVWVLRGCGDECGWEKQYNIDGRGYGYMIPLYCDGDDQIVFRRVDGCFFAYNRNSEHLTEIEMKRRWAVNDYWTIFPHVNSLVSWRS